MASSMVAIAVGSLVLVSSKLIKHVLGKVTVANVVVPVPRGERLKFKRFQEYTVCRLLQVFINLPDQVPAHVTTTRWHAFTQVIPDADSLGYSC